MSLPYKRELIPRAQELRKEATQQERQLWHCFLKDYPVKFRRQTTVNSFILDFYCASLKLGIEIDGSQHYTDQGLAYDEERSAVIESYGIEIIRFSNFDVDHNFEGVCAAIDKAVKRKS